MSNYATELQPYFQSPRAPIEAVQADMLRAVNEYTTLNISLSNISIQSGSDSSHVIVTLDKTYDFSGARTKSGKVQEQIWLAKVGDRWLITGIKDLKTY